MKRKEFIITLFFISSLLIIYGLFPVKNIFQQLIIMLAFFSVVPIVFNKIFLKKSLASAGLAVGDWKQGLIWSGACAVATGVLFFVAIYFFSFLKHYTIPSAIIHNYKNFIFYEFILVCPIIFIYDLFFRGFIMLILESKARYWAILIQLLIFLILIAATKSFVWELVPYLIGALSAGVIVYKSRSIFYSTALQFIIMIILDASVVRLAK